MGSPVGDCGSLIVAISRVSRQNQLSGKSDKSVVKANIKLRKGYTASGAPSEGEYNTGEHGASDDWLW